jgi:hypothetical protein
MLRALSLDDANAGRSKAASIAITAITTKFNKGETNGSSGIEARGLATL